MEEYLFEGGPTFADVEEWKELYRSIYVTEFDGLTFIWRTLTRPEYKNILNGKDGDAFTREELICQVCTLWPKDFDFKAKDAPAGVATLLAEQIMDNSGFMSKGGPKKLEDLLGERKQ